MKTSKKAIVKEDTENNNSSKSKQQSSNNKNTGSKENKDNKESKENKEKENKVQVYSGIGYIHVDKTEYEDSSINLVKFEKKKHLMEGRVSKSQLSEKIVVNLKTLYGSRKVYTFEVRVKDKLYTLIDLIIEEETKNGEKQKWNPNFQYRLISTNGLIKELNPMLTFAEEEIKNNFTIILASPYKIYFSESMKHQGIYVS
jgi:hypothetical protein